MWKKLNKVANEKTDVQLMAVVSGKVELYKGKPQIVITAPEQLVIIKDEEVPASQLPIEKEQWIVVKQS